MDERENSLRVNLAGLELEHPIMNAAGECKDDSGVEKLCLSAASAIVFGSITALHRPVNAGQVFWNDAAYSLNSLGLPNRGSSFYNNHLQIWRNMAHRVGKSFVVSVAGFSIEDYASLTALAIRNHADAIELNLGCPNVWDGGAQKRIVSFCPQMIHDVLRAVEQEVKSESVVFVKVSPYSDPYCKRTCWLEAVEGDNNIKYVSECLLAQRP